MKLQKIDKYALLAAILGTLVIILLIGKCTKQISVPLIPYHNDDSLIKSIKAKEDSINKGLLLNDSLTKVIAILNKKKDKVLIRYKTKYDSIYVVNDSACQIALSEVNKHCMILDSTNNVIIDNQEQSLVTLVNVVGEQSDLIKLHKFKANKDSLDAVIKFEEQKINSKKKLIKTSAIVGIAGFILGILIR